MLKSTKREPVLTAKKVKELEKAKKESEGTYEQRYSKFCKKRWPGRWDTETTFSACKSTYNALKSAGLWDQLKSWAQSHVQWTNKSLQPVEFYHICKAVRSTGFVFYVCVCCAASTGFQLFKNEKPPLQGSGTDNFAPMLG